jgi:hypothetical protein
MSKLSFSNRVLAKMEVIDTFNGCGTILITDGRVAEWYTQRTLIK